MLNEIWIFKRRFENLNSSVNLYYSVFITSCIDLWLPVVIVPRRVTADWELQLQHNWLMSLAVCGALGERWQRHTVEKSTQNQGVAHRLTRLLPWPIYIGRPYKDGDWRECGHMPDWSFLVAVLSSLHLVHRDHGRIQSIVRSYEATATASFWLPLVAT